MSRRARACRCEPSVGSLRKTLSRASTTRTSDERRARNVGRPSKATPFAERVRAWLTEAPDLPTQELLRRATEAGYAGHKTAFYALVAGLRPLRSTPVVRFEGLPGEFSQHDFGHVDVPSVDGRTERVHFFASRLKYSRFVAVHARRQRARRDTGAQPRLSLRPLRRVAAHGRLRSSPDNREEERQGLDVEQYNATFSQAIVDIGVEMCAPRSGWQKDAVEHLVTRTGSASSRGASRRCIAAETRAIRRRLFLSTVPPRSPLCMANAPSFTRNDSKCSTSGPMP